MSFCTPVNCIDGRAQMPVIDFLTKRCNVDYVDCVTEACPVRILAGETNRRQVQSIIDRIDASVAGHGSKAVAIVAHYDCTGNSVDKQKQHEQLNASLKFLAAQYPAAEVIGLWVDENWTMSEHALTAK